MQDHTGAPVCALMYTFRMTAMVAMIPVFVAIFAGACMAIVLPLIMSSKRWKDAEDKARARRLAEAKLNARLLRMNL